MIRNRRGFRSTIARTARGGRAGAECSRHSERRLFPAYKRRYWISRPTAVDQVLDVRDMPVSAAGGTDAAVIQSRSQPTQIADACSPECLDDRKDVSREGVGVRHLDLSSESGCFTCIPRIAKPRALSLSRGQRRLRSLADEPALLLGERGSTIAPEGSYARPSFDLVSVRY